MTTSPAPSFFATACAIALSAQDRDAFEAIDAAFPMLSQTALRDPAPAALKPVLEAYEEGVIACRPGATYANPYAEGSDEHAAFSDGWNDQSRIEDDDHRLRMIDKGRAA